MISPLNRRLVGTNKLTLEGRTNANWALQLTQHLELLSRWHK